MGAIAIYARVSTDEQAAAGTIETQLTACREHAERQGRVIAGEYKDEGVSGAKPLADRPEGKRLLDAVQGRALPFDTVLVYRLDRVARDALGCLLAIETLKRRGVKVESVNERFDETSSGDFARTVMSAVAQLERDLIRERTSAGRVRRVQKGKYQSPRCPFGYTYDSETGQLEPHPQNAEILRQMFHWATDEGLGVKAIAERLDEQGILPPYKDEASEKRRPRWGWNWGTVYKILKAERYTGTGPYGATTMQYPVLIDQSVFHRAQQALKQRQRDSTKNTKRFYLLQHLLWCRHCGGRYMPRTIAGGNGVVYECYQRRVHGTAKFPHDGVKWRFRAAEIEPVVIELVDELIHDPQRVYRAHELAIERVKTELGDTPTAIANAERELTDCAAQEERLLDSWQKGILSEENLVRRLAAVREERKQMEERLSSLRTDQAERVGLEWAADCWLELVRSLPVSKDSRVFNEETGELEEPTPELIRQRIHQVVSRIWVEPDGSLTLEGPGDHVLNGPSGDGDGGSGRFTAYPSYR